MSIVSRMIGRELVPAEGMGKLRKLVQAALDLTASPDIDSEAPAVPARGESRSFVERLTDTPSAAELAAFKRRIMEA